MEEGTLALAVGAGDKKGVMGKLKHEPGVVTVWCPGLKPCGVFGISSMNSMDQ